MTPECPGCGKEMNFPPEAVGRKIKCSACGFKSRIHETDGGTYYLTPCEEAEAEAAAEAPAPPPRPASQTSRRASRAKRKTGSSGSRRRPAEKVDEPEERPRRARKAKPPGAVAGAAALFGLWGFLSLMVGILVFVGGAAVAGAGGAALGGALAVLPILFGGVAIFLALGLLKGHQGARVVALLVSGLVLLSGFWAMSQGSPEPSMYVTVGAHLAIVALLLLPDSGAFFASGGIERPPRRRRSSSRRR